MTLIMFYGDECPMCEEMMPLVERLEKEEGIVLEKKEVWHHTDSYQLCESYDKGRCGGVPFFYNTETDHFLCGGVSYEEFLSWAKGEMTH